MFQLVIMQLQLYIHIYSYLCLTENIGSYMDISIVQLANAWFQHPYHCVKCHLWPVISVQLLPIYGHCHKYFYKFICQCLHSLSNDHDVTTTCDRRIIHAQLNFRLNYNYLLSRFLFAILLCQYVSNVTSLNYKPQTAHIVTNCIGFSNVG